MRRPPTPLPLKLYRAGTILLEPAVGLLLEWRRRRGKEDGTRIGERRGRAARARPRGPLVWMHGASNGEILSLVPIAEDLARRGLNLLVTSGTLTSAELAARRIPPGAIHQFVPVDTPRSVRRFLDHWQPGLAIFAESEIWPNTVIELDRRAIPLVLVNARMSERSFRRWLRMPAIAAALFGRIALALAQTGGDGERLAALGAPRVALPGNLKFDAPAPPADPLALARLSGLIAGRPVWVAASTHPGEEEKIARAHAIAARARPGLLTIIVPRHPRRGPEIEAIAAAEGLPSALRSAGAEPEPGVAIYVADTVGELGLFFRLAPLVLMGGSLVPNGGHNPIEPAKLGAAILHGPHVFNFADVFEALGHEGGALAVADGEALGRAVADLLGDPDLMREMARAASEHVAAESGARERIVAALDPYLAPLADLTA